MHVAHSSRRSAAGRGPVLDVESSALQNRGPTAPGIPTSDSVPSPDLDPFGSLDSRIVPPLTDRRFAGLHWGAPIVAPISAFVGPNGSGKTLAAVHSVVLPALRSGVPVYSTATINHPLYRPLESWRQLTSLSDCVVFLDEINASLPSRQFALMPVPLQRMLHQLRKVNLRIAWTAPAWGRADILLREVTQTVTICSSSLPDGFIRDSAGKRIPDPDGGSMRHTGHWRAMRWFLWKSYDAGDWQDHEDRSTVKIRPFRLEFYRRNAGAAMHAYSTAQQVHLLDHLDKLGTCLVCDGKRNQHACKCPTIHDTPGVPGAQRGTPGLHDSVLAAAFDSFVMP